MSWKTQVIYVLLVKVMVFGAIAQSSFLPAGHSWHAFAERLEIKSGGNSPQLHSMLKPFERKALVDFLMFADSTVGRLSATDRLIIQNIIAGNAEWAPSAPQPSQRPFMGRFYKTPENFYQVNQDELFLVINPVLNLQMGNEASRDVWLYQNTRGVELRGSINQKVGFYSYLADNQARFPLYVDQKIASQEGAIPGEGWNIPFGDQGWDFFTARGYIAFQATPNIGLQFGQDRNFTGHGMRSLLLSDYSNNYLFLKVNTRVGRFHYQNLFARLVDFPLRTFGGRLFDAKYMAAHTLSVNLGNRFQLGLFENVVLGRANTHTPRQFDPHYLNPIIFYRAVEHHTGDADKVAIGMNWRWITSLRTALYGQVYFDDFHMGDLRNDLDSMWVYLGLRSQRKYQDFASFRNKLGLQLGLQWVDVLGISNLDLKMEGNWVRPFTYSHYATDGTGLRPASSYSHYSQALAHPMGANFREWIAQLNYQPHARWVLQAHSFWIKQGLDPQGMNVGANIMNDYTTRQGDYGHLFLQGDLHQLWLLQTSVSFEWKPQLWIDLSYLNRTFTGESMEAPQKSSVVSIGLRLNAITRNHWF